MAHILLSPVYKSNIFSRVLSDCTIPSQLVRYDGKKSVLSAGEFVLSLLSAAIKIASIRQIRGQKVAKKGIEKQNQLKKQ